MRDIEYLEKRLDKEIAAVNRLIDEMIKLRAHNRKLRGFIEEIHMFEDTHEEVSADQAVARGKAWMEKTRSFLDANKELDA